MCMMPGMLRYLACVAAMVAQDFIETAEQPRSAWDQNYGSATIHEGFIHAAQGPEVIGKVFDDI